MLKKMTGTEFALIIICFLFLAMFIGMMIELSSLRAENKKLSADIFQILNDREIDRDLFFAGITKNHNNILSLRDKQNQLTSQTQVLEASLDTQEMRWARIKKVREAIKQVSSVSLPVDELTEISAAVIDRADEYDIPTALLLGLIRQESNFNRYAVSSAGAQGLTQVIPSTANDIKAWLGWKYYNWKRVSHNVRFGALYLARLLHNFEGEERLAIAGYNCGERCVAKVESGVWKSYPDETADYIERVSEWKTQFEQLGITW